MKYAKILLSISILFLAGCASTTIKDGKLQKRTFLLELTPFFKIETNTEGLEIGEAEIKKEANNPSE